MSDKNSPFRDALFICSPVSRFCCVTCHRHRRHNGRLNLLRVRNSCKAFRRVSKRSWNPHIPSTPIQSLLISSSSYYISMKLNYSRKNLPKQTLASNWVHSTVIQDFMHSTVPRDAAWRRQLPSPVVARGQSRCEAPTSAHQLSLPALSRDTNVDVSIRSRSRNARNSSVEGTELK